MHRNRDNGESRRPRGRKFVNPVLAEAVALARQRQLHGATATAEGEEPNGKNDAHDNQGEKYQQKQEDEERERIKKASTSRWAEDDEDEDEGKGDDMKKEGSKKRQHSPIVWHPQSKVPRSEATGGLKVGMGMAERAQAELEEFRQRQQELRQQHQEEEEKEQVQEGGSSPEEDAHIRREGSSVPNQLDQLNGDDDGMLRDIEELDGDLEVVEEKVEVEVVEEEEEKEEEPGPVMGPSAPPPPRHQQRQFDDSAEDDDEERPLPASPPRYLEVEEIEGYPEPEDIVSEEEKGNEGEENKGVATTKTKASMLNECRSVENYEKLNRISEGSYGVVYRAKNRATGEICALKKVKLDKERDGFPLTSIREINVLLSLSHPSIVNVSEVVVGSSLDAVFMVMEYADHDLKGVMDKRMTDPFTISEVKCLMQQLLSGVAYLHSNWVIHRDLKTSNILYTNKGHLKICDFGLARQYGEPLKPYTQLVVTLWYRAPELLLGAKVYSTAVDVWSCGCIMAELLSKKPLFSGQTEISQLNTILKTIGTPTEASWPGLESLPNFKLFSLHPVPKSGSMQRNGEPAYAELRRKFPPPGPSYFGRPTLSDSGFDLLRGLLELCPQKRLSAAEALRHPWFQEHPLPKREDMMPTFPETNSALHHSTAYE